MKPIRTKPVTAPPAVVAPVTIDFPAALAVLFPGIDLDRDVELRDEGAGVFIAAWNRPEPQPTDTELAAVVVPGPNLALTARQARLWLLSVGLDDAAVRGQIAMIADDACRAAAFIEWEYSVEIHLNHPLVQNIGTALGFDAAQLRAAFAAAASL